MPKISLVMPIKNRAKLVKETIQSIIDQTEKDWELLVIDDHSDSEDKTEEIIAGFADDRIIYKRLPDGHGFGGPCARNYGNALVHSDIIAVVDSDDICYPDRLALTLEKMAEGYDIVYGEIDPWDEKTDKIIPRKEEYRARHFDLEHLKQKNYIPHPTVAYRRKVAADFPYNTFFRRAQDYDLLTRLAVHGFKFGFIDKPLVKYRMHDDQVSASGKEFAYGDIIKKNRGWIKQ